VICAGLVTIAGLSAGLVAAERAAGEGDGRASTPCRQTEPTKVPQPTPAQLKAAGLDELPLAPERDRVDLVAPPFNNSTGVTNPLFPIADLHSAILNGEVDGKPFKVETTLLPETRVMEWTDGQCVETLVSQYVAYLDGRIVETALDLYAQDDEGNVWYLGEDVFNYADGVIEDIGGTWHAGKDGPAAMIMPGEPQVGNAYRPENIPGLVFEEVTVRETGKDVQGPRGRVEGAIVVRELHDDGQFERKIFAPGYGEFFTGSGGDVEAIALAVPTDALPEPLPAPVKVLEKGADEVFELAEKGDWEKASDRVDAMRKAWSSHEQAAPPRLREPTSRALESLSHAVDARDAAEARQAALASGQAALDLELQYRPVAKIDLARFDLWLGQTIVDAQADDLGGVSGDHATLEWIRDRIAYSLGKVDVTRIDFQLTELHRAIEDEDLEGALETASKLREVVDRIRGDAP
jgi:hypothetical protein